MVKRPFLTSFTARGAGWISTVPLRQATESGIPGFNPASLRISLGMTNLPAESMVVFMSNIYHKKRTRIKSPKAVARISQKLYTMTTPWSSARANAAAGQQEELHLALCPRS